MLGHQNHRRMIPVLLTSVVLICAGCENHFRVGPEETHQLLVLHQTTAAERNVELAIVTEKVRLPVWLKTEEGKTYEDKWELFNLEVVRPDVAIAHGLQAPRVAVDRVVKVLREDGKEDMLNIGGWYVRKKAPPRPAGEERVPD